MESTNLKTNTFVSEAFLRQQTLHSINTPRFIEYKNKQVVYIDFSNMRKAEEIYAAMEIAGAFIRKQPLKSLYTLTNLSGMFFNNEIFSRMTAYAKENNPYVKASAVVGMTGMMQIFYNSFTRLTGRDVKAFSSEIEAKEFLAGK